MSLCSSIFVRLARHGVACASTFLLALPALAGTISSGIDAEATLPYWQLKDDGMTLRLVQRLPEQSRGFFEARDFSAADAELIAQSCVFQTIFKNTSADAGGVLEYNLRDWVVHHRGSARGLKTREEWAPVWATRAAPAAARIAFEWALLPTRQTYRPGDYNWGMSMFGLAPGDIFDLQVVWVQHGRRQVALMKGIRCASDTAMPPPTGE